MLLIVQIALVVTVPLLLSVFFAWRQLWRMLRRWKGRDEERDDGRDRMLALLVNQLTNARDPSAVVELPSAAGAVRIAVPEPTPRLRVVRVLVLGLLGVLVAWSGGLALVAVAASQPPPPQPAAPTQSMCGVSRG